MASATIQASVHDYLSAQSVLKGRERRKIGNNTYLVRTDAETIKVKYHNTFIAVFQPYRSIYTSGGWHTYTTKDRLNQLFPAGWSVFQNDHRWYLKHVNCEPFDWYDGFTFLTGSSED